MKKKCGGKNNHFGVIVVNILMLLMIVGEVNRLKEGH
jgi:hypothetical protein